MSSTSAAKSAAATAAAAKSAAATAEISALPFLVFKRYLSRHVPQSELFWAATKPQLVRLAHKHNVSLAPLLAETAEKEAASVEDDEGGASLLAETAEAWLPTWLPGRCAAIAAFVQTPPVVIELVYKILLAVGLFGTVIGYLIYALALVAQPGGYDAAQPWTTSLATNSSAGAISLQLSLSECTLVVSSVAGSAAVALTDTTLHELAALSSDSSSTAALSLTSVGDGSCLKVRCTGPSRQPGMPLTAHLQIGELAYGLEPSRASLAEPC